MDAPDKSNPVPAKKKLAPVVTSSVVTKRPASKRFFDFLFAESPKALLRRVVTDVVVPRAKAGVEEAAGNFLSGMLWGDASNRPLQSGVVRGTVIRSGAVNYNAISMMPNQGMALAHQAAPQTAVNYRDLTFQTLQDAENVLANMYDSLNQYRIVAVGDLYELANQPTQISDDRIGWTSLDGARISKSAQGYVLELPRPTLI